MNRAKSQKRRPARLGGVGLGALGQELERIDEGKVGGEHFRRANSTHAVCSLQRQPVDARLDETVHNPRFSPIARQRNRLRRFGDFNFDEKLIHKPRSNLPIVD